MKYRARVYHQDKLIAIVDGIQAGRTRDDVARALLLPRSAMCGCGRVGCYGVDVVTLPDAETSRSTSV